MRPIIPIFLFIALAASSCSSEYGKHLRRNAPSYALFAGAGMANGAADVMRDKYSVSRFPQEQPGRQFWDASISWRNKYKDWPTDTRPAFPGAKTWLVWTTDGWHLAKMHQLALSKGAILTYNRPPPKVVVVPELYPATGTREESKTRWWWYVADFAIYSVAFSGGWHISSNFLIIK